MDSIAQRHHHARAYCHRRLTELARAASLHDWGAAAAWREMLIGIESFAAADFAAEPDALLELAAAQAEACLLAPGHARGQPADPAVAAGVVAACAEFRRMLREPLPADVLILPHRRVLGRAELERIWAGFEPSRQRLAQHTIYEADPWTAARLAIRRLSGGAPIFNLAPVAYFGYELDPAWLDEMLCGDDTYWTAPGFGWYLYADGTGYPVVAGALLG